MSNLLGVFEIIDTKNINKEFMLLKNFFKELKELLKLVIIILLLGK